jgi:serine/threonine protein kinase
MQTNEHLILKGEESKSSKTKKTSLGVLQEGKIYQSMQGGIGIPYMHWCGQEEDFNFLVLEEFEATLGKLMECCGGKFSLKTAMMVGMELTEILQYYHFKSHIYNNLHPRHIMVGKGEHFGNIYIIDFNKSSKFRDPVMSEHIP